MAGNGDYSSAMSNIGSLVAASAVGHQQSPSLPHHQSTSSTNKLSAMAASDASGDAPTNGTSASSGRGTGSSANNSTSSSSGVRNNYSTGAHQQSPSPTAASAAPSYANSISPYALTAAGQLSPSSQVS